MAGRPPSGNMLGLVDYIGVQEVGSAHFAFTNIVSNVSLIYVYTLVFRYHLMENGWILNLEPELKSVTILKKYVPKFQKLGSLILKIFAWSLPTGNRQLLLDEHRPFVGCEKDSECVEISLEGLLKVYGCLLLKQYFNLESW